MARPLETCTSTRAIAWAERHVARGPFPSLLAFAPLLARARAAARAALGACGHRAILRGPSIQAAALAIRLAHAIGRAPVRTREPLTCGAVRVLGARARAVEAQATPVALVQAREPRARRPAPPRITVAPAVDAPAPAVAICRAQPRRAVEAAKAGAARACARDEIAVSLP